jgi:3-hexulose-6-phosphate synthase/6-phospho-3-hexuloisomerase
MASTVAPYVDWIEAGTALIKSEGMLAVRELRRLCPDKPLVADMKVLDGGRREAKLAFGAGADIITVSACADDATLQAVLDLCADGERQVMVDLLGVREPVARAQRVQDMGAHLLCVRHSTDAARQRDAPQELARLASTVTLPIAAAGSIQLDNWARVVRAGASIIIVGGAILNAADPGQAARVFQQRLRAGVEQE